MSYRLNPYKILRSVVILIIIICLVVVTINFKKTKEATTNEIKKDVKLRTKDFYKSKDYKNNLTLPEKNIEDNNQNVINELKTDENKTKNINLKDIQKDQNEKNQAEKNQTEKKNEDIKKAQQEIKEQQKKAQQELEKRKQKEKEEAAKIEREKAQKAKALAAQQKAKKEAEKGPKKYIQVASVKTEATAKSIVKKLGGNFYYKKTVVNGRKAYVVMSNMTNDPAKLNSMQNTVKSRYGGGYMIRGGK
ncbi:SPOR domain-containing protein [Leptotrichia sp. oral taxon 847]|uniref:SPOR domain-containing protein n=1 Tax=Leptotrichia sp. oral taxon 847 TaxID=1785996 RepID=UPI000767EC12|nr:SPOR domain-containing protein [Leptotrichia sp. oral taxon 847]AMD94939.1 hypothetical protein AXF11_04610 [Leptotrichia sp. oral taxon 847]